MVLPDGSVAPWLAESVSAGASLQRWTVTLRPDITFTDGEPMDALTIKTGVDDYLRSGRASGGHLRDARIASVIVADELTLIFELSEPNAGLPAALAGPVGRVFSIAAAEADPDIFARGPVGTGPFFFRRWSAGAPAVLEANPDYWRTAADGSPLPWAAEIQFAEIPDERERLAVLLDGGGDIFDVEIGGAHHSRSRRNRWRGVARSTWSDVLTTMPVSCCSTCCARRSMTYVCGGR